MAALGLVSVQATPAFATRNSAGDNPLQPGVSSYVWTPTIVYQDPIFVGGSTRPVTFSIPTTAHIVPAITWSATCAFPANYAGVPYTITASLPVGVGGAMVPIFRSTGTPTVFAPTSNSLSLQQLKWSDFEIDLDLGLPVNSLVPFRIAGDFTWKLSFLNLPEIVAVQTTRLEFNWAQAPAPSGPTSTNNPLGVTRVNLGGVYPVGLTRMFFPAATELVGIPNLNQVYATFYARYVAMRVWTWGNPHTANHPVYDALNGASFFNVGSGGGSFNLTRWWSGTVNYCNCYDLAAIVQLGCCLLIDWFGNEYLNSRWVYQIPNGYIKPCVLYGWSPFPNGVNNPFFLNHKPNNPYVAPPDLTGRSPFGNHAWIEVQDPMQAPPPTRYVLDVTCAIPATVNPMPEIGSRTRPEYAAAHIQIIGPANQTGNANNRVKGLITSTGNCYTNYDWYVDTAVPNTIGRVGVYDAAGITPPIILATTVPAWLPDEMIPEMERLLAKGKSPESTVGFSDATIAGEALVPIIASADQSGLALRDNEVRVTEGVTVLRLVFDQARYSATSKAQLLVELQVSNSNAHANAALIHALSGYHVPDLFENFVRPSPPLGDISLIDKHGHGIHIVRGNQYLSLKLNPPVPELVASGEDMFDGLESLEIEQLVLIAQRLDTYVSTNTLPPGEQRKPNTTLVVPESQSISAGDAFTLGVRGDNCIVVDGSSSNCSAVICAGLVEGTREMRFYALAEGESELKVYVAHEETLSPGVETYNIVVRAKQVEA